MENACFWGVFCRFFINYIARDFQSFFEWIMALKEKSGLHPGPSETLLPNNQQIIQYHDKDKQKSRDSQYFMGLSQFACVSCVKLKLYSFDCAIEAHLGDEQEDKVFTPSDCSVDGYCFVVLCVWDLLALY